jgi:hypothetical protein
MIFEFNKFCALSLKQRKQRKQRTNNIKFLKLLSTQHTFYIIIP